jgi:hypothetical protein
VGKAFFLLFQFFPLAWQSHPYGKSATEKFGIRQDILICHIENSYH